MERDESQLAERRPIGSRETGLAQRIAAWLVSKRVSANTISVSSMLFALAALGCLLATSGTDAVFGRVWFFLAALFVQCRLLANLFDGMVAVASGQSSTLGELFNEIPDRISDPVILIGAGFAAGGMPVLGYGAALLAVLVAYLRVIGNSVGARVLFLGPMAKPHRMATITAAALYVAIVPAGWPGGIASGSGSGAMSIALTVIIIGCVITSVRRIASTVRQVNAKP